MNKEEREVLILTRDLWNKLNSLPVLHPDDINDHKRDIHNIQNRILARDNRDKI